MDIEATRIVSTGDTDNVNVKGTPTSQIVLRAAHGAVALLVRQGLVYGSNIAGGVILARLLTPAEFGFYGVVLFFSVFLSVFGGTGFAANLIRTEKHPSLTDFRTVFTAQQAVVGLICLGIWGIAPWLGNRYQMLEHGISFFRLIGVALAMTSLMVVPQVLMERELAFGKLAIVEVVQAVTFNLVAIALAWKGVGALSFAIALVVRATSGALLSNVLEPWAMGWHWDSIALKRHLRFGVAVQVGQIISLAKDSITPVFVGMYLGATKMGYVTWAGTLANYPIMLLMPLQRLYLPFFARLQSDRVALRRFVFHALWIANGIAAPLAVSTVALAHPITGLIFGDKWLVALPIFYCFAAGNLVSPCSTPILGLLNAVGKSHLTLAMNFIWMLTTWVVGASLMIRFGLIGFGIALLVLHLTNLVLYWMAWHELRVVTWQAYWPSWPVAIVFGLILVLLQMFFPIANITMLIGCEVAFLSAYGIVLWFGFPGQTRAWMRILRQTT